MKYFVNQYNLNTINDFMEHYTLGSTTPDNLTLVDRKFEVDLSLTFINEQDAHDFIALINSGELTDPSKLKALKEENKELKETIQKLRIIKR